MTMNRLNIDFKYNLEYKKLKIVKRWHHTNSTAIVSYIFNTLFNS